MENIKNFLVNKNSDIKAAMRKIDIGSLGIVFVVDNNQKLFGIVTDGDIRRAILNGINIDKPIEQITNKNPVFINEKFKEKEILNFKNSEKIKNIIPIYSSLKVPIVNKQKQVKDIAFIYCKENSSYFFENKPTLEKNKTGKVLVIGGAGYLGSVLCRQLLAKNYKVKVFDNLSFGDEGIKELYSNKNFEFIKGDIRDISQIAEVMKDVNSVIHLAAIVGDPACAVNPIKTLEVNYLATKMIAETCKYFQINRFIFTSTCSVYGISPSADEELTEESPLNPVSLYAETKIKCEQSVLETVDENFSPTILRMGTLYGYSPHMRFDLAANFLTAKAFFDKEISIFGGNQWRPYLHLNDAVNAHISALEAPFSKIKGNIFNILSENYKISDMGNTIKSIFPEIEVKVSENKEDERNYKTSFNKATEFLSYYPKQKMSSGLIEIKENFEKGILDHYGSPKYRTYKS